MRQDKIRKGFTLVEIMLVIAIVGLLTNIAMVNLIRVRILANEANAQKILRMISSACEMFAAYNGNYPTHMKDLIYPIPPYLKEDYTPGEKWMGDSYGWIRIRISGRSGSSRQGYNFDCVDKFDKTGYDCEALPVECAKTGRHNFQITTGGLLTSKRCQTFNEYRSWLREQGVCFIATACFGTPLAEEVRLLGEFRDRYLLTNPVGKAFVSFYYRISPPLAKFIHRHKIPRIIARSLLKPVIWLLRK